MRKKLVVDVITIIILVLIGLMFWDTNRNLDKIEKLIYEKSRLKCLDIVKVYYYTNDVKMTDSTPNIMASGKRVYEGAIAVSRDLLDYVKFGDCVKLGNDYYIVEDVMNSKHRRAVDIFTFDKKLLKKSFKERLYIVY